MKPMTTFSSALVSIVIAMAFVGASSAMAETTLCEEDTVTCPGGRLVTHIHELSHVRILSSSLTVLCRLLSLVIIIEQHAPRARGTRTRTYSECTSGCTATEENGPSEFEIEKTGHETAVVTGEGLVHLNCSGFINCRYNEEGLEGTEIGPLLSIEENGELIINEQEVQKESGVLCPVSAKLDLNSTRLTKVYITQ